MAVSLPQYTLQFSKLAAGSDPARRRPRNWSFPTESLSRRRLDLSQLKSLLPFLGVAKVGAEHALKGRLSVQEVEAAGEALMLRPG